MLWSINTCQNKVSADPNPKRPTNSKVFLPGLLNMRVKQTSVIEIQKENWG